ncbi:MAG: hypothetical protein ACD_39C01169G0002 [uncultured bacterium]|nr:MAG: hypothetical protein ACD_39C01169G0002 [uncultured bacterium]
MAFFDELLNMFGRRTTGAGFIEAATIEKRNDRKHLGAGAQFENREKIGQIVAQHVSGYRNSVLAFSTSLQSGCNSDTR